MLFKRAAAFLNPLNAFSRCKKWGLPLWQCPDLIFLLLGIVSVTSITATVLASRRYEITEETMVGMASLLGISFLIAGFTIVSVLEKVARANYLRSQFLRILSHQLRSPVTSARWALSIMRTDVIPHISPDSARFFAILDDSIGRMRRLADAVSEVAVTERSPRKREIISVHAIVSELADEFGVAARSSGIRFNIRTPAEQCFVRADREEVRYVVEVLLDNALRFTRGSGTVDLVLSCDDKTVRIVVKDTGIGIPEEEQRKIADPFFRTPASYAMWPGGTGLSLFAARSITESLDGKFSFTSAEHKGSEFTIVFPRTRA